MNIRLLAIYLVMFSILSMSVYSNLLAETNPKSKLTSEIFDKDCSQEFESNEMDKDCVVSVTNRARQMYTPECLRQIELGQLQNINVTCEQEMQTIAKAMLSELQQCLKRPISQKCKEQVNTLQKAYQTCAEARKKVYNICAIGQGQTSDFLKCYDKYRAELEAACRGLK